MKCEPDSQVHIDLAMDGCLFLGKSFTFLALDFDSSNTPL